MTPHERIVNTVLKSFGLVLRRDYAYEYGFGPYHVDFVVFAEKLIIEVDGATHRHFTQQKIDRRRDEFTRAQGYSTIRIEHCELDSFEQRVRSVLPTLVARPVTISPLIEIDYDRLDRDGSYEL